MTDFWSVKILEYLTDSFFMQGVKKNLLNTIVSGCVTVSEDDKSVCSYPLLGVDDVFPHEFLGNRRHVSRVGQNHFL